MALQDHEFERFKRAFITEQFDAARLIVQRLLVRYPKSFALRWHHTRVLEKLRRFAEARTALNEVLRLRSQFVPALVMQVQLDFHESDAGALSDNSATAQQEARFAAIEQRLYKILSIDPQAVDALYMLSGLLRGHADNTHLAKAEQLLDRAISLAPERVDFLEDRANSLLARAVLSEEDPCTAENSLITFTGVRYSRQILAQALADFERCYALSQLHRHGLRVGAIQHDLGHYSDALATYDQLLANMPATDPLRAFVMERRARSDNNGVGEREHIAQVLAAASAAPDAHTAPILPAVQAEAAITAALSEQVTEHSDARLATRIAAHILSLANEPPPNLVAVNPKDYPLYQQQFSAHCKRALNRLELHHVCYAEAKGLHTSANQRVLLSFFADEFGDTGVVCFCLQPKPTPALTQLRLLFTGQWRALAASRTVTKMVQCVTQFNNGDYLCTQYPSPSPFRYGSPIYIETLALNTSPAELVNAHLQRLAEYKAEYPIAKAMRAVDLDSIEARWLKSQAVKRHYRSQIGYISEPELQQLLGAHYTRLAPQVRAQINLLAADL